MLPSPPERSLRLSTGFLATAASLVPSLEEVMPFQVCVDAREVHVAPESVEVHMFPSSTVAASLVPSLEEVMAHQSFEAPTDVSSVQVTP